MAPLGFLPHLGHHHLIFTFTSFLHLNFSSLSESWIRPVVGRSGYFCYNQTYYIKHILSLINIFFFLLTFVIIIIVPRPSGSTLHFSFLFCFHSAVKVFQEGFLTLLTILQSFSVSFILPTVLLTLPVMSQ